jgi:putative ABC transport system permease protein
MRAVSRRHEIAARLALGASRRRLVRQLLAEGAVLSLVGGGLGAAVAFLAGPVLFAMVPVGRLPSDFTIAVDGWVLAFTAGLCVLTGLVVGLAPIAQTWGGTPSVALRTPPGRQSHRMRHALVVAEVALTLVLLVGAGLLLRSFVSLSRVPLGFLPERIMTMTVDFPVLRYPEVDQTVRLHARLLDSLRGLPGVESAAAVNWLPLGDLYLAGDVQPEGRPDLGRNYVATKVAISADYFRTMGIRLVRGRPFTRDDRQGRPPVAIVSEAVARRLWPGGDPLNKRIALVSRPTARDWLTVVGVVEDVRQSPSSLELADAVYQPYEQVTNRAWAGYMTFLVRAAGDPEPLAPMMREALAQLDRDEAPQAVTTLEAVVARTVAEPLFQARVLVAFALAALLLAAVGIYGVLASAVLERRTEIGVRMALGADRTSVMRTIGMQMLALTGVGLAIGVAGALASTTVLESLLFNVTPTDLPTFGTAVTVLIVAAIAAAVVPARRASRLDPVSVLRAE